MHSLKIALLCGALLPVPAFAETAVPVDLAEGEAQNRADIVVTASRTEQPRIEAGQSITIVTREEIETRQTVQLSDLLRTLPGVSIGRNGGVGQPTSLFIRGGDSSQTLVLIDGVRINDPSAPSGAFDFGNLLAGNIARIELLRGPNAVIWGSQAIGGVINIQTIEPEEALTVDARGEYGYRDTAQGVANIAGTSQISDDVRISGSVGGGYFRSDGISAFSEARGGTEKDGYENIGLNGKLRVRFGEAVTLDLRGYYNKGETEFDNPPGDTAPVNETEQFLGYVGLNVALFDGRFRNRFAYARTDIRRKTTDPTPGSFNPFDAKGVLDRFEYQGVFDAADFATLVFGLEHEDSASSTFFAAFDPAPDETEVGLTSYYGQLVLRPLKGLTLTGGVRVDDQQVFGSKTSLGANIAFTPDEGTTVFRGTYAEGFRAPALSELLANFGNPLLTPETARSFDIGVERSLIDGKLGIGVTAFHRDTDDLITFSAATFMLENVSKARARGLEFTLWAKPAPSLTVQGQVSVIDTENRSTQPDFSGNVNFGNDLARRPSETASLSIDWQSPWGVALGSTLLIVGDSFDDLGNATRLDGYALVDIRASVPVTERIELYGRVDNLFDTGYETAFNYGSPGRAAYVGARLKL